MPPFCELFHNMQSLSSFTNLQLILWRKIVDYRDNIFLHLNIVVCLLTHKKIIYLLLLFFLLMLTIATKKKKRRLLPQLYLLSLFFFFFFLLTILMFKLPLQFSSLWDDFLVRKFLPNSSNHHPLCSFT